MSGGAGRPDRREAVLAAALETFLRHGYRKTSMEDVAAAAAISRPGLYFLFASKQELFAAAVARALAADLDAAARALGEQARPLPERLLAAFDAWTGRYLGAAGGELSEVVDAHRDVMHPAALAAPQRFRDLVTDAVVAARPPAERERAQAVARTLVSVAVGLKHQTTSREEFRAGLATAVDLLLA